ncbi:MAG: hypothetical protein AAF399_05660 [Bacteroidota bacterium]
MSIMNVWGIENIKDGLEVASFIATIIGGIAILSAVRDYSTNRKQLNFSALESCIVRFREEFLHLGEDSPEKLIVDYIDLINEELFFFEEHFLPKSVAAEWIDGMVERLPLYSPGGELLNPGSSLKVVHQQRILEQYRFRRVKRAFTLRGKYDMDLVYGDADFSLKARERKRLVKEIMKNLNL